MKPVRHFLEYILALSIIGILSCLNVHAASSVFGYIFKKLGPLHSASKVASRNLIQAFPKLSMQKVDSIISQMWENFGRTAAELIFCKKLSSEELNRMVRIKISPQLKKLMNSKRPVIIIFGHYGNWELLGRVIVEQFKNRSLSFVYREPSNKKIVTLLQNLRSFPRIIAVPKGFDTLKGILKAINSGGLIYLTIDQRMDNGKMTKFFGKDAPTSPLPAKIALHYKCPIVFARIIRNKGVAFKAEFTGPMNIKNASEQKITSGINKVYELWAKEYPGQWFWVHRRYQRDFYN